MLRVVVIGGGAMGEAFARGMLAAGVVSTETLVIVDRSPARCQELATRFGIRCEVDPAFGHGSDDASPVVDAVDSSRAANGELSSLGDADVVIIAVKPKSFPTLAEQLAGLFATDQILISIVAGLTLKQIYISQTRGPISWNQGPEGLGTSQTIAGRRGLPSLIRAMPNTPAQIGAGVTAWYADEDLTDAVVARAESILKALGATVRVENESDLDIATALSGSGPAYVFLVIEAMIDAGVHCGLDRAVASVLAIQTVIGAGQLAASSSSHPATLRNAVTSPGGTTAAGLAELESAGLRAAFDRAIIAAHMRSRALGTMGVQ